MLHTLTVETTSNATASRAQAVKVLEEAAEVFASRDMMQKAHEQGVDAKVALHLERKLADEIADLIISATGLAQRWNIDLASALARKSKVNKERGY